MITLDQETIEDIEVLKELFGPNRSLVIRSIVSEYKTSKPELFEALKMSKTSKQILATLGSNTAVPA